MTTGLVTLEELQANLPSKKRYITQEAVDIINKSVTEPEFQGESLLKTATTYEAVLKRNKASIPEYLNAIRFCAYLTSVEENITEAYKKTFSDRDFVKQRITANTDSTEYRELTSAASRYRKSKLVGELLTLSQVPLNMMFVGETYKAVAVLADRMVHSKLDRDKINAAKELLAAVKGPENLKIELDVGVKENSAVEQLNQQLAALAVKQRASLDNGVATLDDLGAMKAVEDDVIEGELDER